MLYLIVVALTSSTIGVFTLALLLRGRVAREERALLADEVSLGNGRRRNGSLDDGPLGDGLLGDGSSLGAFEPLTVLKPICGADDRLEENLESFFWQDYPGFELIFGVEESDDPALPIICRLQRRYPHVRSLLVVHGGRRALNPKVANLMAMVEHASYDALLVSDSNVRAHAGYLREMADALGGPSVGLVTSLIVARGEETLGATLNNLQFDGVIAGSIAASHLLRGDAVVIGKSSLFRRGLLRRLGGLESLASVLAEDYVIERMMLEAGYRIALSRRPVEAVCEALSLRGFLARHVRWAMLRWRLFPFRYPLELCVNPTAVALAAPLFGVAAYWPWCWALALTWARDLVAWVWLRGRKGALTALALGVPKDALMLGVWLAAPLRRRVCWRGSRLYLSAGTRLYAEEPLWGGRGQTGLLTRPTKSSAPVLVSRTR